MLFCDGLRDAWEDHHHPTMTLWDRQNSPSNNKIGPLYSLRLLLARPRIAETDGGIMPTASAKEREVGAKDSFYPQDWGWAWTPVTSTGVREVEFAAGALTSTPVGEEEKSSP